MQWTASWRKKPASVSQIGLLMKFNIPSDGINMGLAADLITRRIHGAIGGESSQLSILKKRAKMTKYVMK